MITDVLRTLKQSLAPEDLTELEDLFARHGEPFQHESTDTDRLLNRRTDCILRLRDRK